MLSQELQQAFRPEWYLEHYQNFIVLDSSLFEMLDFDIVLEWQRGENCWLLRGEGNKHLCVNGQPMIGKQKVMQDDFLRFGSVEFRLRHVPYQIGQTSKTLIFSFSMEEKIVRAIDYLISQRDWSTQPLADALGIERSTLYRHTLEIFGLSPSQLILQKRLEYAAEFLALGSYKIKQVAYELGFKSMSHFSRSFNSYYGMRPSYYTTERSSYLSRYRSPKPHQRSA